MGDIQAVVVEASDYVVDAPTTYAKQEDIASGIGGKRTNIKIALMLDPTVAEFMKIPLESDDPKVSTVKRWVLWGGGYGQRDHNEFLYLQSLNVGDNLTVHDFDRTKGKHAGTKGIGFKVPEGWIPGSTQQHPPPATGAPAEEYVPVRQAPPPEPMYTSANLSGYAPLTDEQKIIAEHQLADARWIFEKALLMSYEILEGVEVNGEKVVELATTFFIECAPWKIKKEKFNPANLGLEVEEPVVEKQVEKVATPGQVKSYLLKRAEEMKGVKASEGLRKQCIAGLTKLFPDEKERHEFTNRVFEVESTNDLKGSQLNAIINWHEATSDNNWTPSPKAMAEAEEIKKIL